jgi:hypothetical protein
MIKKNHFDWVVADIPSFGTCVFNQGKLNYLPANCFAVETKITK